MHAHLYTLLPTKVTENCGCQSITQVNTHLLYSLPPSPLSLWMPSSLSCISSEWGLALIPPIERLTQLCVRCPSDASTKDNIYACTNEEIDWSPMPAVLRAENWALIGILRSTPLGAGGFDIVAESTISSSHRQRSFCYDVQTITIGNAHLHSPFTHRVTVMSTVQLATQVAGVQCVACAHYNTCAVYIRI